MKITPEIADKFPEEFQQQCIHLKNTCACGTKFSRALVCPACGTVRPRCKKTAMNGEDSCRSHITGRPYSLYTKLSAQLTDTALEEFLEKDERDLSQEYALAKMALSGVIENQNISSQELMLMVKDFFTIAEKRKKIEDGDFLQISWNDDLVNALKKRFRTMVYEFQEVIKRHVTQDMLLPEISLDDIMAKIMTDLQESTKVLGNKITSPLDKEHSHAS